MDSDPLHPRQDPCWKRILKISSDSHITRKCRSAPPHNFRFVKKPIRNRVNLWGVIFITKLTENTTKLMLRSINRYKFLTEIFWFKVCYFWDFFIFKSCIEWETINRIICWLRFFSSWKNSQNKSILRIKFVILFCLNYFLPSYYCYCVKIFSYIWK